LHEIIFFVSLFALRNVGALMSCIHVDPYVLGVAVSLAAVISGVCLTSIQRTSGIALMSFGLYGGNVNKYLSEHRFQPLTFKKIALLSLGALIITSAPVIGNLVICKKVNECLMGHVHTFAIGWIAGNLVAFADDLYHEARQYWPFN
jgi:hypothetical protein